MRWREQYPSDRALAAGDTLPLPGNRAIHGRMHGARRVMPTARPLKIHAFRSPRQKPGSGGALRTSDSRPLGFSDPRGPGSPGVRPPSGFRPPPDSRPLRITLHSGFPALSMMGRPMPAIGKDDRASEKTFLKGHGPTFLSMP